MPSSHHPTKHLHIIKLLTALGIANVCFISAIVTFELHYLHDENSLLENLQAVILMTGLLPCLIFRSASPEIAIFNQAFALLCFSFLLRELDVEYLDVPVLVKILGSGTGKVLLLASLWGSFLSVIIRRGYVTQAVVRDFVDADEFRLFLLAMLLLAISALMDRQVFTVQFSRLYEEMAEINAYLLLVIGSLLRSLPLTFFVQRDQYQ